MTRTESALIAIPIGAIVAAYRQVTGDTTSTVTKMQAVKALAQSIDQGRITLEQVRHASMTAPMGRNNLAPQVATVNAAQTAAQASRDTARLDSIQAAADRADRSATALSSAVGALHTQLETTAQDVARTSALAQQNHAAMETVQRTIAKVAADLTQVRTASRLDPTEIASEIRTAIDAAIKPVLAACEASPEVAAQVAAQVAQPVSRQEAVDLFGIDARDHRGKPLEFDTWGHPEAPPVDPAFIWTEEILRHLYLMQETGRNVWLGGPAGTGKTQTIQQFAARTGRMFRRFVFDRLATREDYLGATGLDSGSTVFQSGPVLDAYVTPGAVCLLDEVGMGNPSALSALNGFLEPGARMAYADRVWTRAPGTLFAAADNSLTQGDQSGRFAGVGQMNTAFSERFAFVVPFKYLDRDVEAKALAQHAGCTQRLAEHVIDALTVCRSKVDTGDIIDPPSIRQAIAFVQACRVLPVPDAWHVSISARQPAESSVALAAVYASTIDADLIGREI
jgi:MoxR-like ATPase